VAAAAAGCGLGAGKGTTDVSLLVTRDFGTRTVLSRTQKQVPGAETVMQLLQRSSAVGTKYGGGFVESIGGLSGTASRRDWFFYVNGIEATKGAAATPVHHGDRIWWDLHDWSAAETIPAVVGLYPEPFTSGSGGKRLPTVLDCATDTQVACTTVAASLRSAGVPVSFQGLGTGSGSSSLAIVVGTWRDVRGVLAAELVASGPGRSGVYAQFVGPGGQAMELDDPKGQVAQTVRGSAGLVAATQEASAGQPTWLVTGTDVAGVSAAARALTPARLRGRFALVVAGSRTIPVPVQPGR
jgi:hypothetical protein